MTIKDPSSYGYHVLSHQRISRPTATLAEKLDSIHDNLPLSIKAEFISKILNTVEDFSERFQIIKRKSDMTQAAQLQLSMCYQSQPAVSAAITVRAFRHTSDPATIARPRVCDNDERFAADKMQGLTDQLETMQMSSQEGAYSPDGGPLCRIVFIGHIKRNCHRLEVDNFTVMLCLMKKNREFL